MDVARGHGVPYPYMILFTGVSVRVPTVFLDKDGTLIPDIPYNVDPDKITLSDGAEIALRSLHTFGYKLIIISNQSGVAQGYLPEIALAGVGQLSVRFPQSDAVLISDYGYRILTPRVIQTIVHLQSQSPRTLVVDSKNLSAYRCVKPTAVKPDYHQALQLLGETDIDDQNRADWIVRSR